MTADVRRRASTMRRIASRAHLSVWVRELTAASGGCSEAEEGKTTSRQEGIYAVAVCADCFSGPRIASRVHLSVGRCIAISGTFGTFGHKSTYKKTGGDISPPLSVLQINAPRFWYFWHQKYGMCEHPFAFYIKALLTKIL